MEWRLISRNRFPSLKEAIILFLTTNVVLHIWAITVTVQRLPAYMLYLNVANILGITSYSIVFALIESFLITLLFIIIAIILPSKIIKDQIVSQGVVIIPLILMLSALFFSLNEEITLVNIPYDTYQFWIITFIALLLIFSNHAIRVNSNLQIRLNQFADRLVILSILYIFIDGLAILYVLVRNIPLTI